VILLNSLRLTGNGGEVVVLDIGLTPAQRRRLEPHARLVEPPGEVRDAPMLVKSFPHMLEPEGVTVVIDSDMMVTRPLDPIVEQAAAGKVCLFADIEDQRHRWIPEWEQAFGLAQPPRRQHYLNAGFIALSTTHWPDLLRRYWECCERIPAGHTMASDAPYEQPFWGGDQDAINALLMSEVDEEAIVELPEAEGPSADLLGAVRVRDERTLECELRGRRPYLMHYWGGPKPWQRQAWMRVRRDAFVTLMPRVLFGPDVPVRMDPRELPRWARPGRVGGAELSALTLLNGGARLALRAVPRHTRARLARAIRRR
jgi:hypothetical protein